MASEVITTNDGGFVERVKTWPTEIKDYYADLKAEMRRVTWPAWKQVRATTLVVIVSVFMFAAYFRVVDYIVGTGISKLIASFTK
jgi:preprotein translocase subunit SecE